MISNWDVSTVLASYLERYPEETELLSEATRLLSQGGEFACRRSFPMHVTAGVLLVRGAEILLVKHRAYGILLQPGGHLEPTDASLADAAQRELVEETGIDPATVVLLSDFPAYIEYGSVPARPEKNEPDHFHLDIGFSFGTANGDVGSIQECEVTGVGWCPLAEAEQLVGARISRALTLPAGR